MKRKRWYGLHRWIAALGGLQLAIWCLSGLVFASHDIEWVRGNEGRRHEEPTPLPLAELSPLPPSLQSGPAVTSLALRALLARPVWEARYANGTVALFDAQTGAAASPLDETTAYPRGGSRWMVRTAPTSTSPPRAAGSPRAGTTPGAASTSSGFSTPWISATTTTSTRRGC